MTSGLVAPHWYLIFANRESVQTARGTANNWPKPLNRNSPYSAGNQALERVTDMMGHRQKLKGGDEWDAVCGWRNIHCYLNRPGVAHSLKKKMSRRARRETKLTLKAQTMTETDNGYGIEGVII